MERATGAALGVLADSDDSADVAKNSHRKRCRRFWRPEPMRHEQPIPTPSHQSPLRKHQPHFA